MQIKMNEAVRAVARYVEEQSDKQEKAVDLAALSKGMSTFSDEVLRLTVMMEKQTSGPIWQIAIALATSELGRRADATSEKLALKTTRWSVGVGGAVAIVAAIAGAVVGAKLS